MKKKMACMILAMALSLSITGCGSEGNSLGSASAGDAGTQTENVLAIAEEARTELLAESGTYFSDGDYKDVTAEEANAFIVLSGNMGTLSDTSRGSSGETVTITSKGIYHISGTGENVTILIKDEKESGNVYLILDNVTMKNESGPCIVAEAADKVIVQCVGNNALTYSGSDDQYDGVLFAKSDLTINGNGTLSVTSAQHGIVCKKDLKLTGGEIRIEAASIGIRSQKTVRLADAELMVEAGHDGIQVKGSSSECFYYQASGKVCLTAGYDGIDAGNEEENGTCAILLAGGELDITAGGGSDCSKDANTSQKGIKSDGDIKIGEAVLNISSADDALHASGSILVTDGTLTLSTSDDGIHADKILSISGGETAIVKSYEGLEGYEVMISGGSVSVTASDDGVNAAGGSDTASAEEMPASWKPGTESTGTLTVSGGMLYVNAGGDGLDSNGSLYVTGGTVIVEGPLDNGNAALDRGDSAQCVAEITGGTVLAIGTTGMAINFDSGSQCSGLVQISGEAGTTISVEDGSGFSFTVSKAFQCLVYSSPFMTQGNVYQVTAGSNSAELDFSAGLYYSNVAAMGGPGGGGFGGQRGK